MSVCGCGRSLAGGSNVCDRCAALLVLDLAPGASELEIKDAYRTLAKVWHPDRFPTDQQLRLKAEEKIKEINSAYQLLTTAAADDSHQEAEPGAQPQEAHRQPGAEEFRENAGQKPSPGFEGSNHDRASQHTPPSGADWRHAHAGAAARRAGPSSTAKRRVSRLVVAVAILVIAGIWIDRRYEAPPPSQSAPSTARATATPVTDDKGKQVSASGAMPPGEAGQPSQSEADDDAGRSNLSQQTKNRTSAAQSPRSSLLVYPREDPGVPYFTVGSTKKDVIRVQGPPSEATDNVFRYGLSEVYFKDGRVESWHMDSSSPLKARMPEP